MSNHDGYFNVVSYHPAWQISRENGLVKYLGQEFFANKTLLEVGCIFAYFGNMAAKLGSDVTVSDVRVNHINVVHKLYPNIKTRLEDLDKPIQNMNKYDVIIHFGLLYHLFDAEKHILDISQYCDYLILETEVCDTDDEYIIHTNEYGHDQAYNRIGIRPSAKLVEKYLKSAGFNIQLILDPILNGGGHVYDWDVTDTKTHADGKRRFWICWKTNVSSPIKN